MAAVKPLNEEAAAFVSGLSAAQQSTVAQLRALQAEHAAVEAAMEGEIRALQQRFEAEYRPLYAARRTVVAPNDSPDAGVPDFWATALSNLQALGDLITDADTKALHFLVDLTSEELPDNKGFALHFHFAENPYFANTTLTKTYTMPDAQPAADAQDDEETPTLPVIEGTPIQWKPGKNLAVKIVKKKQRHKGRGDVRVVTKEEPAETFFNFFNPPKFADMPEEEKEVAQDLLEMDLDLGYMIHEKIIPNAVKWYTGQALEEEDMYFGDEDDEDDDDEDEDQDEDEDEEEEKPKGAKSGAKGSAKGAPAAAGKKAAGGEQPQECKQQ